MKALLLISHGSRRTEANDEILDLAEHLNQTDQSFDLIRCGFLEIASPSIDEAAQSLIDAGADEIIALPYFLVAGWHVERDIPDILDQVRKQNPDIRLLQMPHIGSTGGMKRLLQMHIQQAAFQIN